MKTMHLFSGAGGGLLCDLILGHEPVVAVEWDKYCCRVLRERSADGWFPDLHVWEGDVRLFNPSEYAGRVDCIHAGFPCQDISVAGNQAGVGEGTRSGLYREVLRIADIVRPRYLFLENVAAILANRNLGTILGDLATRGYDARWCCLEASGVGAPHKRDRWWMLARLADAGRRRLGKQSKMEMEQPGRTESVGSGLGSNTNRERQPQPQGVEQDEWGRTGDLREDVADARGDGLQRIGDERQGAAESEDVNPGRSTSRSSTEGFSRRHWRPAKPAMGRVADGVAANLDWWSQEPDIGRVATGISNRTARLKMLGNGQVPLQAAAAWAMLGGPM